MKQIYQNKKRENKLRGIYERGSVLSAKRQKLTEEKLEKEIFKN